MDFVYDDRTQDLRERLLAFMDQYVYPAEPVFTGQAEAAEATGRGWERLPVTADLKAEARRRGLWNLFLTGKSAEAVRKWEAVSIPGTGRTGSLLPDPPLTNLQYAPLAEITGWSPALAPEALNCAAPDTGNMEVLAEFGSPEQQERWLRPLLEGTIRSAFCMTEPAVASSDASNIATTIRKTSDGYVINGRKWWSSGAMSSDCKIFIVMGVTGEGAAGDGPGNGPGFVQSHGRHSMILVPRDTPGIEVRRGMRVFGYTDGTHGGHAEIDFTDVHVPAENLIAGEGEGFAIAQARLGPGRIHHCMRQIGAAERALELMCQRALARTAFGKPLAEQGVIQDWIAESRVRIEQARLLVLKTAWLMDTVGNKGAHTEIQAIKIVTPAMAEWVIDKAIQAHGGGGVSQEFPLAHLWASARTLRFADGPDEVHKRSLARRELRKTAARTTAPRVDTRQAPPPVRNE
jgi:acyl-CoA dehydrogenase